MKKIYYSVILSLAFSLFSCSDFLDRESLSESVSYTHLTLPTNSRV